jgi:methionyl-tRNA formyltransferase
MDIGVDTGDILSAVAISIEDKETNDSLHEKLAVLGAELVTETLIRIEKGEITAVKQDDNAATYAPMLNREEGEINWLKSAVEIERLIRGLNSRPGAYTYYHNRTLKIWAADPVPAHDESAAPGTITEILKDKIVIACGEGCLAVTELQLEGKKKMPARDFLLGCKITAGEVLSGK